MADLCFAWGSTMINVSIKHQAAAYAAAKSDIKHRVEIRACAMTRFPQRADVRIIVHPYWRGSKLVQPACQIEFRPTFDLVRLADLPASPVNRATKTNTNGLDFLSA